MSDRITENQKGRIEKIRNSGRKSPLLGLEIQRDYGKPEVWVNSKI
jgi:hypothetical protein